MADRFWVGGTGNWNDTARWAATSGGAGGETVPTAADNAYFDSESDTGAAFTVTINVTANCKDFIAGDGVTVTALDQTMTLAGSSAINIYGSLFFPATSFTKSHNGNYNFRATTSGNTITTNGKNFNVANTTGEVLFDGVGGEWTLGSSITLTNGDGNSFLTVTNGVFRTGDFNVTGQIFRSTGTTAREMYFGSSILSFIWLSSADLADQTNSDVRINGTNLILDAGTSELRASRISIVNPNASVFLNKVRIGNTSASRYSFNNTTVNDFELNFETISSRTTVFFDSASTFGTAVINARTADSIRTVVLSDNVTVTSSLSLSASNTSAVRRLVISSSSLVTARTIDAAAITIGDGIDFQNITIAGAASPLDASTKSTGDLKGNTGITFPAPKTVYWNLSGSQNWSSTAWATTSTGTPAAANFPLAQDTAVITEAGAAGTITMNAAWSIGTLTCDDGVSPRTSVVSFAGNSSPTFYGDLKLSSGVLLTATGTWNIGSVNTTNNITSVGKTFSNAIHFTHSGTGGVVLQDNFTTSSTAALVSGNLNLNGKTLTCGIFNSNNTNTRALTFGTNGKIATTTGGGTVTPIEMSNVTNLTVSGTSRFELTSNASSGTRRVGIGITGFTEANAINIFVTAGSDTILFFNNSKWNNLDLTGFSGTFSVESTGCQMYGNLVISPTVSSITGGGSILSFLKTSGIQTITGSNKSVGFTILKGNSGTLRMLDSFSAFLSLQGGVFDLNGNTLTSSSCDITNGSTARELRFGSGQLILSGTGTVFTYSGSNFLVTPNTGKIVLSDNSSTARTFIGGGILTYPELEIGGTTGTSTTTITGVNGFAKLTSNKTVAHTIVFPNATTRVANWNVNGTEGNLVTLSRTGGSGVFTIQYTGPGYGVGKYMSISNSTVVTAGTMYALFSTDGGSNTNWVFDGPRKGQFLSFFDL
jgi:hypothetical protein